jgi:CDP-glucose 4,6-dehydratase
VDLKQMTICVTGASGFIGSHLMRAIPWAHPFRYPEYDLRSPGDAFEWVNDWKPDVVFHLAAQSVVTNTDPMDSLTTNIDGTYNLLEACRRLGTVKSFIHISTDKVYGDNSEARTASPLRGTDHPYNASKLCGDVTAQLYRSYYHLPIHIVRTGNIYGAGDTHYDRIVPGTIKAVLENKPIELRSDGKFLRDYIYIDDLIPAYLRIADEPPGIYNLGGECVSVFDLVQLILSLMEREDLQPVILDNAHNEIPNQHVVDCPEWWQPATKLEDGLRKTIAYYRQKGF